jgi:hypothetical protein
MSRPAVLFVCVKNSGREAGIDLTGEHPSRSTRNSRVSWKT